MNIEIRKAGYEDLDCILSLYPHLFSKDDPSPERSRLIDIWNMFTSNTSMTCFLAEIEKQSVGTCCIIVVPNLTGRKNSTDFSAIREALMRLKD